MTCASIGRESPRPGPIKSSRSDWTDSSVSNFSAESIRPKQNVINTGSDRKSPKMSPKHHLKVTEKTPKTNKSPKLTHSIKSNAIPNLSSYTGSGEIFNTDLDRYLRATASLYGTAFPHPALTGTAALTGTTIPTSGYPIIPGLLPHTYIPYIPGTNFAGTGIPTLSSYLGSTALPRSALSVESMLPANPETPKNSAEKTGNTDNAEKCNWGSCGKTFPSPELLAAHVKIEHLSTSTTVKSSSTANLPVSTGSRFSPYTIPGHSRDLLASRYVYS